MDIRELDPLEWTAFFLAFSRHYRGMPVTVELTNGHPPQVIAKKVPLMGITAECHGATVTAIEVIFGTASNAGLKHVVTQPSKVRIAQVTNGCDELMLIDPRAGPTTRIDFSAAGLDRLWSSGTTASEPAI